MSIYKYEEAFIDKLRDITGDDRIIITNGDINNVTTIIGNINKDEIKLPLIQITRLSWEVDTKHHGKKMNGHINNDFPLFGLGPHIAGEFEGEDGKIHRLHLMPMNFTHKINVWTKTREENDEMIRELIWFFATIGRLYVNIPYGINLTHEFTLEVDGSITDETNIPAHLESGQLFIQSFNVTCQDAALWKSSEHNPTCIHITSEIKELNHPHIASPNYNKLSQEELGDKL